MKEPITVDTPCASYDMVPTLANLFGLDYDSRIITGKDILAENADHIVVINTLSSGGSWNWITAEGQYGGVGSKRFTPSENCTIPEEERDAYVSKICQKVAAMRKYSCAILDNDYYRTVFNNDFTLKAVKSEDTASAPDSDVEE